MSYLAKYWEGKCWGGGAIVGKANVREGGGQMSWTPQQDIPRTTQRSILSVLNKYLYNKVLNLASDITQKTIKSTGLLMALATQFQKKKCWYQALC